MKKRIVLAIVSALFMLTTLTSCNTSNANKIVGVCMPTKAVDRWLKDGDNIKKQLDAKGYKVMLEYADYDSEKQIAQIETMINSKCNAIIIAAADCYNLNDVLEKAAKNKIKVIAYDRLIMDSEYVDYYCTFDNVEVGAAQGQYIVNAFDLGNSVASINMEIFSGSLDGSCTPENYNEQMRILESYINSGEIIVTSGQTDMDSTGTADWSIDNARARMKELLSKYYSDGTSLDVVLSTNDSLALGIIDALAQSGYGTAEKPFPVITGQDRDKENVVAIINDKQSMSMFIDTRALSTRVVEMVDDLMMGNQPVINDSKKYDNGAR